MHTLPFELHPHSLMEQHYACVITGNMTGDGRKYRVCGGSPRVGRLAHEPLEKNQRKHFLRMLEQTANLSCEACYTVPRVVDTRLKRQLGDLNPCGQSPEDFESTSHKLFRSID